MNLSIYLFIHIFIYEPIHLSIYKYIHVFLYMYIYIYMRAGLRFCQERNELHLNEAYLTAQAHCMTFVHLRITMFHVKFSENFVGKVSPLRTS